MGEYETEEYAKNVRSVEPIEQHPQSVKSVRRFEPIDGGKKWCVHHWKYHYIGGGNGNWYCARCGATTGDFFMAPPDFMTFELPFILAIGVIGGTMFAAKALADLAFPVWIPFVIIPILSLIGSIWWIRKALE